MMQEVTEYHPDGDYEKRECVIDEPEGYELFRLTLIDTQRHSHQGKWNKVRQFGVWGANAYFGQGNGVLVREDLAKRMFPVMSLPRTHVSYDEWLKARGLFWSEGRRGEPEAS